MDENRDSTRLAYKLGEAERLLDGPLDRETELDLLQLCRKIALSAKERGLTIQTDNVRLSRLLRVLSRVPT